jgi:ubiquitin-conjugating enzyme E2 R
MSGESAGERWSPVQRVETVLISIISLLDSPEISSPANVDASVQCRDHQDQYKERVKQDVTTSKKDIPEGFVMPTHESTKPPMEEKVDEDFWQDSDAEELDFDDDDDFDFDDDAANGSESDAALNNDSEDEDDFDEDTQNTGKGKSKAKEDAEMTDA